MEMLTKNIVMSGCGCGCERPSDNNADTSEGVKPAVGEFLNSEMINAIGLARAYVPVQPFSQPMEDMASLSCGTVFGPLVMPYVKGSALARYQKEECGNE